MNIKVSKGNTKLGRIAQFNLLPGVTCSGKAKDTCYIDGCYAKKSLRYPNVNKAWTANTKIVIHDLPTFKKDMMAFLNTYNKPYFRIHTSGDFVTVDYFKVWIEIIKEFPEIRFLAYTKQFQKVLDGLEGPSSVPDNLSLYLSLWEGEKMTGPADILYTVYELPRTAVIPTEAHHPVTSEQYLCPGDCRTCKVCYYGQRDVNFIKH